MKCEICDGHGDYPIVDSHGRERYCITCPECRGSGEIDDDLPPPEWPPRSTAADIFTKEELAEAVKKWNRK
jgi:hypothetical protein